MISLAEIVAEFEELDDPTDRMTYLVEIGKTLPPFPESARTEDHRVLGCQSMVWLVADERGGNPPTLNFTADSDAPMVRGLIAILLAAYSGKTPEEIVNFPIEQLIDRFRLRSFITPMRSNGLFSMIRKIRELGEAARQNGHPHEAGSSPLVLMPLRPRSEAARGALSPQVGAPGDRSKESEAAGRSPGRGPRAPGRGRGACASGEVGGLGSVREASLLRPTILSLRGACSAERLLNG